MPEHSSDTLALIRAARHGAARTRGEPSARPWRYTGTGIVTNDLVPLPHNPWALIGAPDRARSSRLIVALDACNARWGRGTAVPAGRLSQRDCNTKL